MLHRVRVGCAALLQGAIQRDGQHLYSIHRGHRRGCALYHSSSAATATYVTAVASNTAITTFATPFFSTAFATPTLAVPTLTALASSIPSRECSNAATSFSTAALAAFAATAIAVAARCG